MNLTITPLFTQNKSYNFKSQPAQKQNLPANSNLAPLARDTVSFGAAKAKKVVKVAQEVVETVNGLRADKVTEGRIDDFNRELARTIARDAVVPMGYLQNTMTQAFKKLVSTEMGDDRIIHSLGFRIKTVESIDEKLQAVGFKVKKKARENNEIVIFNGKKDAQKLLSDVLGARIVMRDPSKKAMKKVLQILGQLVKEGRFKVDEIESFFPMISSVPESVVRGYRKDFGIKLDDKMIKQITRPDFFNYADTKDLSEFAEICRRTNPDLATNFAHDLPNGYQALHVNVTLPDGTKAEVQIMGRDVELLKDKAGEDDVYKKKCKKKVRNALMSERLAPLADKNESVLQADHIEYTRWAYIGQRLKSMIGYRQKPSERFLTAPRSILDRGLGYNQLFELKNSSIS